VLGVVMSIVQSCQASAAGKTNNNNARKRPSAIVLYNTAKEIVTGSLNAREL